MAIILEEGGKQLSIVLHSAYECSACTLQTYVPEGRLEEGVGIPSDELEGGSAASELEKTSCTLDENSGTKSPSPSPEDVCERTSATTHSACSTQNLGSSNIALQQLFRALAMNTIISDLYNY